GERPRNELQMKEPRGIDGAGHQEPALRHSRKTDPRIIGLIADEDDKPVTERRRLADPLAHQRAANPELLSLRMNGKRPEPQPSPAASADFDWPEADRAHQPELGIAGDEGQALDRMIALTQTIGGLGLPIETEGKIEQRFDEGWVRRSLGLEDE